MTFITSKPFGRTSLLGKVVPVVLSVVLIAMPFVSLVPSSVSAATAVGPNSGSTFSSVHFTNNDFNWDNPGNAKDSDNSYATADLDDSSHPSQYLKVSNFGFNIPVGASINGIVVSIKRHQVCNTQNCTGSQVTDNVVSLVNSSGAVVGNNKADTATAWGTSDATPSYGGSSDIWNTGFTRTDINSSGFGVVFAAQRNTGGKRTALVDQITVTVYYTPALSNQTITFGALGNKTYGNADFTVSATASSGLSVSFASQTTSVCTVSGTTIHIVTAGTCTIHATQAGNASYNAATPVDQSLTVAPKTLTAGLTGTVTKVYDGTTAATLAPTNYTLTGIVNSDAVVLNNPTSGTYDTKNVGTGKTVSVSGLAIFGAKSSNYTLANTATSSAIGAITTSPLTVTANSGQTKIAGASDPVFTYTTTGTVFSGDLISGVLTRTTGESAGLYPILIGSLTAGSNYYITYVGANFSVTPAFTNQTITFSALSGKTYGDADFSVSATASSGLPVSFSSKTTSVCTVSGSMVHIVSVGTCTIEAMQSGDASYNAATPVDQSFTVAQKALTADLTGTVTKVYDGTAAAVLTAANYILTGVINGDAVVLNNPILGSYDTKDVGTGKTISVTGLAISGAKVSNYTLTDTATSSAIGTITASPLTVTANSGQTKIFGVSADPLFSYTVTGTVFSGDLVSGTLSRAAGETVGFYPIGVGTLTAGPNYNLIYVGANFSITPADSLITLGNLIQDYDGTPKAVTVTTNPGDLTVSGVMYTGIGSTVYGPSMTPPIDAGTYAVTASSTDSNQIGSASDTLTVHKVNATITVTPYNVTFDGKAHTAAGVATGVGSVDLSGSLDLTGTTHTKAGTFTTDSWTFTGGTDYNDVPSTTIIDVINKAQPTCTSIVGYSGIFDSVAHGATGACKDINGETLGELDLGSQFTNVPGGTAHWVFTDSTGNYNNANGDVDIVIGKTSHMLTYTADAHGSITGSTTQMVIDGTDGTAVTAVANSGYHFTGWSDASTTNPRTDSNVTGNIEVIAQFAADPVVTPPEDPTPTPEPTPTPPSGGGGNGPIVGSFGFGGGGGGQVLGASTTTLPEIPTGCSEFIHGYMRLGKKNNDPADVKKLQQFLNDQLHLNLPINGIFGPATDKAVRQFQAAHADQVLNPWGLKAPTGFVYKTTQRWINLANCASLNIPLPDLTPYSGE